MAKALILIIDESRDTRTMYADYFRYHGYAVAEAANGMEGARISREIQPDLIVTELTGEVDWLRAIRVVGHNGTARETAVIACSTVIDPCRPWLPHGVDIDAALAKPASPRTLLHEVEHLLGRRSLQLAAAGA
jgi:DNA-binding response OmpR family regulator